MARPSRLVTDDSSTSWLDEPLKLAVSKPHRTRRSEISQPYGWSIAEGQHNPSFEGSWTDEAGDLWRRKGKRGRVLEDRRIRSLLRRDDVPLIVWQSFETSRYDDPVAKQAAAQTLDPGDTWGQDIVASEWLAEDGRLLLMLEHFC